MRYKTLVSVPVFNETNVCDIIQKIKKFSLDILVVDDGSADSLHKRLRNIGDIHLIVHTKNLGYGKTIIDAFRFAIKNEYDYLLTIDGDGQHDPEEIPLFLKEIPFYDYAILSGSRYFFHACEYNHVPKERYLVNKEITAILNRITGFNLTDSFCGFKAYNVEALKLLYLTEYGYGMPLQLWIQTWKMGLRVREIPVKLIYKDITKRFKGILEDPVTRLCYYKNIIEREISGDYEYSVGLYKEKRLLKIAKGLI